MASRRIAFCAAFALCVALTETDVAAQSRLPIVDRFTPGDEVTIQGCVKVIPDKNAVFLTQITTWPILRRASAYGPYHFWTSEHVREIADYIGDTVQMKGRIIELDESEMETEPGLHRFGDAIAVELPIRDVVVDAVDSGVDLSRVRRGADIPLTLAQVDVDSVMRVMRGCVATAEPPRLTARPRR